MLLGDATNQSGPTMRPGHISVVMLMPIFPALCLISDFLHYLCLFNKGFRSNEQAFKELTIYACSNL
jgi:hypothetical protein